MQMFKSFSLYAYSHLTKNLRKKKGHNVTLFVYCRKIDGLLIAAIHPERSARQILHAGLERLLWPGK